MSELSDRAAIEAGIPVLVEKPVARTLDEGHEIVRRAAAADVRVGVNYQYRYDAGCYALAQAARQGDLGELYYGRCNVPWVVPQLRGASTTRPPAPSR